MNILRTSNMGILTPAGRALLLAQRHIFFPWDSSNSINPMANRPPALIPNITNNSNPHLYNTQLTNPSLHQPGISLVMGPIIVIIIIEIPAPPYQS
jgi:hypothetical protein